MTDRQTFDTDRTDEPQPEPRRRDEPQPVDESSYGASAAESGGLYREDAATVANTEGDTMGSAELERDEERRERESQLPGVAETHRSGS